LSSSSGSRLDPFKDTINALLQRELDNLDQPARSVKQILDHLVTEHGATGISYSMVRNYVSASGQGGAPGPVM
jgi:hypothetical protein